MLLIPKALKPGKDSDSVWIIAFIKQINVHIQFDGGNTVIGSITHYRKLSLTKFLNTDPHDVFGSNLERMTSNSRNLDSQ